MSDSDDIGSLEELEPAPAPQSAAPAETPDTACLAQARRALQHSPAPAVLLDAGLRIRWANPAFGGILGETPSALGTHLSLYFAEGLDELSRRDLYRSTHDAGRGFSWKGRLERRVKGRLPVLCNILIAPLFEAREGGIPAAFVGVFDDISAEHRAMLQSTFNSLLEAARLKDNDTGNHIERVNRYCAALARALMFHPACPEVDAEFLENISYLAAMHDVGKIGTPDEILNKQGALDSREWEIMRQHTINGAYIMSNYPDPMGRDIAQWHHERWDGSGYPHALQGAMIPLSARMVAVADVYDALRMGRPYKGPMPHDAGLRDHPGGARQALRPAAGGRLPRPAGRVPPDRGGAEGVARPARRAGGSAVAGPPRRVYDSRHGGSEKDGSLVRHRQPDPVRQRDAGAGGRPLPGDRRGAGPLARSSRCGWSSSPWSPPRRRSSPCAWRRTRPRLRRAGHLDAHLLPGEDVDRGAARPGQAVPAPAHPVQPGHPLGPPSTWTS